MPRARPAQPCARVAGRELPSAHTGPGRRTGAGAGSEAWARPPLPNRQPGADLSTTTTTTPDGVDNASLSMHLRDNGDALTLDQLARLEPPFAAEAAELFAQLDAMDATRDTLVSGHDAVDWGTTGMDVVDLTQTLTVGGLTGLGEQR